MSIINKYLYGWQEIEPIILSCVANDMNIMCLGKHGIGKSSFADFITAGVSSGDKKSKCVVYHMQNEDMLSMVGCPMPKALAEGKFEFAAHDRSVLDADVAVFDEVTRAPKETENMVLSILEERRVFGKKLPLKFVIATANDATYKNAMNLDAAHMDRYVAVIPIPDMNGGEASDGTATARYGSSELEEMMHLNFGGRDANKADSDKELRTIIEAIRDTTEQLWSQQNHKGEYIIKDNVIEFCSKFIAQVMQNMVSQNIAGTKKGDEYYMSLREAARDFPRVLMACAAYYKTVHDDTEYLRSGAMEAMKYSIATKLLFPMDKLIPVFNGMKELLTDGDAAIAALKVQLSTGSVEGRIKRLFDSCDIVTEHFGLDEQVNIIGMMLNDLDMENCDHVSLLLDLHDTLESNKMCLPAQSRVKIALTQYAFSKHFEMVISLEAYDPVPV